MKNSTLLGLAAVGVAAYLILKAQPADAQPITQAAAIKPIITPTTEQAPQYVAAKNEAGNTVTQKVTTMQQGINFINTAVKNNTQLQYTSQYLGRTDDGQQVIKLPSGATYGAKVVTPSRDTAGLTSTDRSILARKGLAPTTANAKRAGLI